MKFRLALIDIIKHAVDGIAIVITARAYRLAGQPSAWPSPLTRNGVFIIAIFRAPGVPVSCGAAKGS